MIYKFTHLGALTLTLPANWDLQENHQALLLSAFVLASHAGGAVGAALAPHANRAEALLGHWLQLKLRPDGGFYEPCSAVYSTLTLAALLNLLDFLPPAASELHERAEAVARRLMQQLTVAADDTAQLVCATSPTPDPNLSATASYVSLHSSQ